MTMTLSRSDLKRGPISLRNNWDLPSTDKRWWAGLKAAAQDAGDREALIALDNAHQQAIDSSRKMGISHRIKDSVRDAMIPVENTVSWRPEISISQESWLPDSDFIYQAFGYSSDFDPLAEIIRRPLLDFAGRASRWCCGIDPSTVSANMTFADEKLEWYSIGFSICWTTLLQKQFWVIDQVGLMQALCVEILMQALNEVAVEGDPIQGIRGLKQLGCPREALGKPLDQMDFFELYSLIIALFQQSAIQDGAKAITKTHALVPTGFKALLSRIPPAGSCSTTILSDLIGKATNFSLLESPWMDTIGRDGGPAMFLYNRQRKLIRNNVAFLPTMLAPTYECGELKFQFVARRGGLEMDYRNAGLFVENVFSPYC